MTHYFANVLYLSICMLGNCSCFYFRLLTFFKIKFLKINHPGPHRVSNSLDPDQNQHFVGLHLGSNCLQNAIGRRQNYPLVCKGLQRVNTLVFNILSHIGIYMHMYTINIQTLKYIHHAMPFKQSKSNIQKI